MRRCAVGCSVLSLVQERLSCMRVAQDHILEQLGGDPEPFSAVSGGSPVTILAHLCRR